MTCLPARRRTRRFLRVTVAAAVVTLCAALPGFRSAGATTRPGSGGAVAHVSAGPTASAGYWLASTDGHVTAFGDAPSYGSAAGPLAAPVVGLASTPDGRGYWLAAADGGVFAFGDASFDGSMGGRHLNRPVVGIAAAPGGGYWLVGADGGVFAFGAAAFDGSMGADHLDAPVVGIAAAPGGGYREVASDGGVFAFGTSFFGAATSAHPAAPIVGITPVSQGGYFEVGADGGVFSYGPGATFAGSLGGNTLAAPIVGMADVSSGGPDSTSAGYDLVGADGGVFSFGTAFAGSLGGSGLDDMVGVAVPSPTTLPVSYFLEAGTTPRAVVYVSVAGGAPERMVLDTGSTGIHLYTSGVGTDGLVPVAPSTSESYAGVQYTGPIDRAPVTVGGVASVAPVDFMDVQTVNCLSADPTCLSPSAAALLKNGIYGTIGVSLSAFPPGDPQAGVYSPLLQLPGGIRGFTIAFQSPTSGTVSLGAGTPATGSAVLPLTSRPTPNANGSRSWDDASAEVCWSVAGAPPTCSPGGTTFDTGTSWPGVDVAELSPEPSVVGNDLKSGQTVSLSSPGSSAPFWSYSTTATQTTAGSPASYLLGTAGLPIYFDCAVTYNAAAGEVVVTPDTPAG
jgi:hypothetical protein